MYISNWVGDGEEGVLENHLVGNCIEMNPHVLEVGHQNIEVVVDDICGHLAGPFAIDDISVGHLKYRNGRGAHNLVSVW